MKKIIAALFIVLLAPFAAQAHGYGYHGYYGGYGYHNNGAVLAGVITGAVIGAQIARPPIVVTPTYPVYQQPPVYAPPPMYQTCVWNPVMVNGVVVQQQFCR